MSDQSQTGTPALKERAGVVNALIDGTQTVLVRHPTLDPGTIDGQFVLYPAYTHQEPARYQSQHEAYYNRASTKPSEGIPIRAVATVEAEYHVPTDRLDGLARHYVYTPDGLREKYGSDDELRILLLRVATLESPQLIDESASYRGCRAWITLSEDAGIDPALESTKPVLDVVTFAERRAAIEDALE